jgi:hypothetical protein
VADLGTACSISSSYIVADLGTACSISRVTLWLT